MFNTYCCARYFLWHLILTVWFLDIPTLQTNIENSSALCCSVEQCELIKLILLLFFCCCNADPKASNKSSAVSAPTPRQSYTSTTTATCTTRNSSNSAFSV